MSRIDFSQISGAMALKVGRNYDERGFFEKIFDKSMFASYKLNTQIDSIAISSNTNIGTLRGLHFQSPPFAEDKIVSCIAGSIFDVVVDLRFDSPTFCKWAAVTLESDDEQVLYLPAGVAHGFQTLEDNSTVLYGISSTYSPENAYSIRYSDPELNISWPIPVGIVSKKDAQGLFLADAVNLSKDDK
jgi:dTDP-4-dehydrorhamnose 3,5-epimerase